MAAAPPDHDSGPGRPDVPSRRPLGRRHRGPPPRTTPPGPGPTGLSVIPGVVENMLKIVVFGAGGVGGYFGGRLAQAGQDLTFIARGAHLDALKINGLRVESICGDFVVFPTSAHESTKGIGPFDVLIIATKSWQLEESIDQIRPLVSDSTIILPLLNGIEHIDILRSAFGFDRVIGGLCRISAFVEGPGHIKHVAVGDPVIEFGVIETRGVSFSAESVVDTLMEAFRGTHGVKAIKPDDTLAAMWRKFALMSGISGVGAMTQQSIGEYRSNPTTRALLVAAVQETVAIGRARGINLGDNIVTDILRIVDVTEGHMKASMHRDIESGKPSELEAQTGAAVRLGRATGVATPMHSSIYAALLPLEIAARQRAADNASKTSQEPQKSKP
jgi:2-dehydropantoate 2-reductase